MDEPLEHQDGGILKHVQGAGDYFMIWNKVQTKLDTLNSILK